MNGKSGPRAGLWYGTSPVVSVKDPSFTHRWGHSLWAASLHLLLLPVLFTQLSCSPGSAQCTKQVTPVPQTSPLWSLGLGRKDKPLWEMSARNWAGGMVWWQGKASTERADSVFRNRSVFGKDRQGEEWLWWTERAELSSIGHVRRWKKCSFPTCVVTENSRNYMYVLSFGQLKGYDKSFPRAPNPPRLTCEDRSSLSLRRDWTWVKVIFSFFEQYPVLFYHAGHLGSHLEKPPILLMFPAMEKSSTTTSKLYWRLITLAVENVLPYF